MSLEDPSEYQEEVVALSAPLRHAAPPPGTIVFYGSSSVRMWETLEQDMTPLAGGRRVLNLGFGGSTLAECAAFFDELPGRVPAPRAFVVYAGENDLNQGASADDVVAAYRALHDRSAERFGDVPFLFLGVKPSPTRPHIEAPAREANRRIAEEIARRPHARFIDVDAAMRGPDGRPMTFLWAEDGVHLSRAGYDLWTRLVADHRDFIFG